MGHKFKPLHFTATSHELDRIIEAVLHEIDDAESE